MTRELFVLIVTVCLWLSLLFVRRVKYEDLRDGVTAIVTMIAVILSIWLFAMVFIALPSAFPGVK